MIGLAIRRLQRSWTVLIAGLLILAPALYAFKDLQIDNDPRKLAPTDAARDAANARHEKFFGADDTLLVLVLTGDDISVLTQTVEALEDRILDMDEVLSVRTPTNVRVPLDKNDGLTFTPAFGRRSKFTGSTTDRIAALETWTGGKSLVSSDGRHMVMVIRLDEGLKNPLSALKYVELLETVLEELVPSTVTPRMGGLVATRVGSVRAILTDGMVLFPLVGLIVFLMCFSRFRSVGHTTALMTCLGWSILMTTGFAAAMGYSLNPLTQIFPILLMIIGIADGMHLVEGVAEGAGDTVERWALTLTETGGACVLTTMTTAIGFLALLLTRIPVLHEFALIVSVGLGFSLVANLFLLPALCLVFCKCPPSLPKDRGAPYGRIVVSAYKHGRPLMALGVILLAAGLFLCTRIDVDFYLSRVLDEDAEVSEGNRILRDQFGGSIPIEVTVTTSLGDFNDPKPLAALDTLGQFLTAHSGIIASHAVGLKKMRLALVGEDVLPTDRATAAQLELFLESAKLEPLLAEDRRVARISAVSPDVGAKALLKMQSELGALADNMPNIDVTMVGSMIGAAEGFRTLVMELIVGLFIALLLVILVIGLSLKSFKMALISVLPNSLPIVLGIAIFPATGRYLDVFSAVFFTVALGIAVDDTIHLLKRFQLEQRRGGGTVAVLERAGRKIGAAVADTSWVLMSGFALLMLSGFPANRLSGALAAGLIGAALVCDLIFVPAGIALFRWEKSE